MVTLAQIKKEIDQTPTIMELSEELTFMKQLMELSLDEIKSNLNYFLEIIHSLSRSHVDTFFEVTEATLPELNKFSEWLIKIGNEIPLDLSDSASFFN